MPSPIGMQQITEQTWANRHVDGYPHLQHFHSRVTARSAGDTDVAQTLFHHFIAASSLSIGTLANVVKLSAIA